MKLTITDYTGQISADPALWPDDLKKAIAKCCCGQSSSSSTPPGPPQPVVCCPSVLLPSTLNSNFRNTFGHDGSQSLRFYEDPFVNNTLPPLGPDRPTSSGPPWIPTEGHMQPIFISMNANRYLPSSGWYSDLIEDDCQNGSVRFEGSGAMPSIFDPNFITSSFILEYTYKVYYYVWFGYNYHNNFNLDYTADWKGGCGAVAVQLCYPEGRLTTTMIYRRNGQPTSEITTYIISFHDQAFRGGAGQVVVPYPGIPGTLLGGGTGLNTQSSITGWWYFPMPFSGGGFNVGGDVVCSPFKIRMLPYPTYTVGPGVLGGRAEWMTYGCGEVLLNPHLAFDTPVATHLKGTVAPGLGANGIPENTEVGVNIPAPGYVTSAQINSLPHLEVFP